MVERQHGFPLFRVEDEKGIEYPMTLSNYGRELESQGGDGSYKLGILKQIN